MGLVTTAPERLSALVVIAVMSIGAIGYFGMTPVVLSSIIVAVLAVLLVIYQLDYLHPTVAFVLPWLGIIGFSMIPISRNARQLAPETYGLVLGVILVWMVFTVGAPIRRFTAADERLAAVQSSPLIRNLPLLTVGFGLLYLLALLNIAVSGYIPILELALTGDSLYAEFGIPSVYGFFFAYANALGCLAFYVYLRKKERKALLYFLSVILIHLLFVTRQHLLTLLIEAFIIRCFTTHSISRLRLLLFAAIGLIALNFLGELRSGDIRETIHIADEYQWIPGAAAWLYAYSYFNVLNLENTMAKSDAPYFDGTSLQTILPSVLRPEFSHSAVFEIPALNILSYIYPIYLDIGIFGVMGFTAFIAWVTARSYRRGLSQHRFGSISAYSMFYYSAIMSFFTAFWLYLPVVFQLVFFWIFEQVFFSRRKHPLPENEVVAPALDAASAIKDNPAPL